MSGRLLVGVGLLLFGRQLFWLFVAVMGFLVGLDWVAPLLPNSPSWLGLLIAVSIGVLEAVLDVFEMKMEVAAVMEADAAGQGGVEFGDAFRDDFGLKGISQVGMGSADDVGGAAGGCHFEHGDGLVEVLRAVIEAVEDVAMNIDEATTRDRTQRTRPERP